MVFFASNYSSHAQVATGASFGMFTVKGDMPAIIDYVNSFHVGGKYHFRPNTFLDVRLSIGRLSGLQTSPATNADAGGTLIGDIYHELNGTTWYPNYFTTYTSFNFGLGHRIALYRDKIFAYGILGAGVGNHNTYINLVRGEDRSLYDITFEGTANEVGERVKNFYDQVYETKYDETTSNSFHFSGIAGIEFSIKKGLAFTIEYRLELPNTDGIDAVQYDASGMLSNNMDRVSYVTIGILGYIRSVEK